MSKVFDLSAATARPADVDSDPSTHPFGMQQTYEEEDTRPRMTVDSGQIDAYREDGDQGFQALVAYTGQNFAMPLVDTWLKEWVYDWAVPGLDVTCSIHGEIDRDRDKLTLSLRMVGDGFPNAEAFLLDSSNNALFLATHRRIGSALHQLRGNRRIAMASTSLQVDFSNDRFGNALDVYWCLDYASVVGAQIDVLEETGVSPTTRTEWNNMHSGRDARGELERRAQDTIPTFAPGRPGSSMP